MLSGGDITTLMMSGKASVLRTICVGLNRLMVSIHYTFHSDVNDQYTLTDHFICSPLLTDSVKCTHILFDCANTSDYLAIALAVTAKPQAKSTTMPKAQDNFVKLQWDKADLNLYHSVLSGLLSQLTIPTEALCYTKTDCQKLLCALQAYYSDLVSCLHNAASKVVPNVKVNLHNDHSHTDHPEFSTACAEKYPDCIY